MWIAIILIIIFLVIYIASVYNKLVRERNKVKDQWSQIDVQLKRRVDLIPNLVETVKGYAKHEKDTFKEVVEARNKFNSAGSVQDEINANNQITQALNKLFALSEAYPELKANENFLSLQSDLRDVEEKISYARQFYNDTVLSYNNAVQLFPSNIVANLFGFNVMDFFKLDSEEERKAPKVQF